MSNRQRKPRIIFDRSAFHGEHFDALVTSPLLRLAKLRQISIYHTASLIEETASLYMRDENRPLLDKQLPFILEICNGRWLQPTEVMWVKELVEWADEKKTVFVPNKERQHMEAMLKMLVTGSPLMDENALRDAFEEKMKIRERSERLRGKFVQMRENVAKKLKESAKRLSKNRPVFQDLVASELIHMGELILMRHLDVKEELRATICRRWVENQSRFPYFTSFVIGILYAAHYAMTEHDQKIDINSQMDIEYLTYLHGTDILVSNDIKFMKSAFDELWSPKGRTFMTTNTFTLWLGRQA